MSIGTQVRWLWLGCLLALAACGGDAVNLGPQMTAAAGIAATAGAAVRGGAGMTAVPPMSPAPAMSATGTPTAAGSAGAAASMSSAAGSAGLGAGSAGSAAATGSAGPGAAAGSGAATAGSGAAGSGSGAATAGSGAAGSGSAAPSTGPTFTRVWTEVLMIKGCSGEYCHGSGMGGLMLKNKQGAYDALVNVAAAGPACAAKGGKRVVPGMPDASLLLDKLSHTTPSCGDMMPVGAKLAPNCLSMSPPVCTTEAEIGLVRDWILAGAKND